MAVGTKAQAADPAHLCPPNLGISLVGDGKGRVRRDVATRFGTGTASGQHQMTAHLINQFTQRLLDNFLFIRN